MCWCAMYKVHNLLVCNVDAVTHNAVVALFVANEEPARTDCDCDILTAAEACPYTVL